MGLPIYAIRNTQYAIRNTQPTSKSRLRNTQLPPSIRNQSIRSVYRSLHISTASILQPLFYRRQGQGRAVRSQTRASWLLLVLGSADRDESPLLLLGCFCKLAGKFQTASILDFLFCARNENDLLLVALGNHRRLGRSVGLFKSLAISRRAKYARQCFCSTMAALSTLFR